MTAATRSSRFFRHRRRSIRSPHPAADMHRTSNKILVIANRCAHRCGNPYPVPCAAPSPHRENGFPRRCAPRNDIFMKMRCPWTGGAEPPPLRMFCKFLCRAAPMCAAARQALHLQRRGTLAPPYRGKYKPCVGDDAHIVPSVTTAHSVTHP